MTYDNRPYREKLLDPRWQMKRLEVLKNAGAKCEYCGSGVKTLHVHHAYYERGVQPWEYPNESLTALCKDCHEEVEQKKLRLLKLNVPLLGLDQVYGYAEAACNIMMGQPVNPNNYEEAVGAADAIGGVSATVLCGFLVKPEFPHGVSEPDFETVRRAEVEWRAYCAAERAKRGEDPSA